MLAYAANRPVVGKAPSSPSAMLLIISAHVALIALVMSAKMEITRNHPSSGPLISVPIYPPPPPIGTTVKRNENRPIDPQPTHPEVSNELPPVGGLPVNGNPTADPGPIAFGTGDFPEVQHPVVTAVRHAPRLLTPADELKPPYPESKLLTEEEAVLTLRLAIDERGRVVDVQPVGRAEPVFLAAARRYLIAHWRYQPATEDGNAIASSQLITLHFQLDG